MYLKTVSKASTEKVASAYKITCRNCGRRFFICQNCYRNHRYCSESCQLLGYEERRARARQKYNQSEEAILDHRDRQRRYRLRLKMRETKKSVTDQTSMALRLAIKSQGELVQSPHCARCGVELSSITEVFCEKDRERAFKGSQSTDRIHLTWI